MDAQKFLAEFEHIVSAPGGVQRLREMIYNLSITGDLTEHFLEDGDAQCLLKDIEQTRQGLIRTKKFKRTAKLESAPLAVPANIKLPAAWCWTRLLDIGEISPRNEAKDDVTAAFIPMSSISEKHGEAIQVELRSWGDIKQGYTHFAEGDVVLAKITPCFENGKAAVITKLNNEQGIGAGTTELHVFRPIHPGIHPGYIYIFLRSPFFVVEGTRNMTGTAGQKRLPMDYFATRAMPLPPFTEQVRIVTKVDEMMALCDKLEALQQKQKKLHGLTRSTVLGALADSNSSHDFKDAWQRLQKNTQLLFRESADIDHLRATILNLASAGYLEGHKESDSEVVALFKSISQLSQERKVCNIL